MTPRAAAEQTLSEALGLGGRELVSLVGAGGKTTALRLLAGELAAAGGTVLVTTTTAMRTDELDGLGQMVLEGDDGRLSVRVGEALREARVACAARALADGAKVSGLSPATVDRLWLERVADHVVVEADGSAGRPLKAFAGHEPQVPAESTLAVLVAGLGALGRRLLPDVVHRAELLAEALRLPLGAEITASVFSAALRLQLRRLRGPGGRARLAVLLTRGEARDAAAGGLEVARRLFAAPSGADDGAATEGSGRPDVIVLADLRDGRFTRLEAEAC